MRTISKPQRSQFLYLLDGFVGLFSVGEGDEGITPGTKQIAPIHQYFISDLTYSSLSWDPSSASDPRFYRISRNGELVHPRKCLWESFHRTPVREKGVRGDRLALGWFLTSQPLPGEAPSHPGGGPPYFLWPVVTSRL